ncbi:WD40/YVTN/BNR-like repeat-containing protein [Acidobacteriota bacterium]
MKNKKHFLILSLLSCLLIFGSGIGIFGQDSLNEEKEILKSFEYRALGPARQGVRILTVAAHESDPFTFYLAVASGGVWKTVNNGTTFTPVFDNAGRLTFGALAIAPSNPNVLWVGTGDAACGRLTIMGDGVYKSTDAGKTWTHMGLTETRHIGRIAIHPKNPDIVYVAALGYHFSFNEERGLYKTLDGGKTWKKSLFISDKVGVVEVAIDPVNPDIVYANTYDKWRVPWHFEEAGPETGIYKSMDGGETWKRLGGGLPDGKLGRSGLAIFPKNPNIIYATIDNFNTRPPTEAEINQAKQRNQEPQESRVGGEVYRTEDAGESWTKMSPDNVSVGGGKWYGQIIVDPNDDKVIYVPSTPLLRSTDGGKTWGPGRSLANNAPGVHVDHHTVWINPENSKHVILGNDGGLAITYDFGKTWDVFENIPAAQFYAIGVDMDEPYNIYGGTQDTGSVKIPSNGISGSVTVDEWASVGGGDGMFNQPDPKNSRWLYNDSQFGVIQRLDQQTGVSARIQPRRGQDEPPLRFNWNSPIRISPHNSRIIYIGSQVLHRSINRGDSWQEISPDLTTNDPEKLKGNIEHCNITSISESPVSAGLIWVGTDDGNVQITQDGGAHWTNCAENLEKAGAPLEFYVSRVFASNFNEGTAYAVKTGFQRDNFEPLVFKTDDYGVSWASISANLPQEIIYVIFESEINPDLLFVGTDIGVFVTLNGGKEWHSFRNNMPINPVHDLLIHPRENDLVVGSYGRGFYVTDISPLQEFNDELLDREAHLFKVEPKIQWTGRFGGGHSGQRQFLAPNEPSGIVVNYYLKKEQTEDVAVKIMDPLGNEIRSIKGSAKAGLQKVVWDMRGGSGENQAGQSRFRRIPMVSPGEYVVVLKIGETSLTQIAKIRKMPGN